MKKALGTDIKYEQISMEDARSLLKSKAFSEEKIESLLSAFESINRMQMMYVSPDYPLVTAQRQANLKEFFNRNKDLFIERREE
jgi:hypothetical protein